MEGQWRVAKVLESSSYRIEFQRFYEGDKRVSDKNRIVAQRHNYSYPCMTATVSNNFGNYYYQLFAASSDDWESLLEDLYLDNCAFYDDFDSYSDTYKDINGFRPRYTPEQWDERVRAARSRGY